MNRIVALSSIYASLAGFAGSASAQRSNVYVNNTTDSTVSIILNYVLDESGQKKEKSATWTVEPGKSDRLVITGEDLLTTEVGYFIQTTFGARTPTSHGKVWYSRVTGSGPDARVLITITDNMVYKLPDSEAELQALLTSLESTIEILGREVRYYERLKDQPNDDFVMVAINAAAYFDALARYQRSVSFRQAVVAKLARIE